jgi:hypothetical protein
MSGVRKEKRNDLSPSAENRRTQEENKYEERGRKRICTNICRAVDVKDPSNLVSQVTKQKAQ